MTVGVGAVCLALGAAVGRRARRDSEGEHGASPVPRKEETEEARQLRESLEAEEEAVKTLPGPERPELLSPDGGKGIVPPPMAYYGPGDLSDWRKPAAPPSPDVQDAPRTQQRKVQGEVDGGEWLSLLEEGLET